MKLPIVKHILVFTTWGQKCPHSEPEQFTFDNFQSNHPVLSKQIGKSRNFENSKNEIRLLLIYSYESVFRHTYGFINMLH